MAQGHGQQQPAVDERIATDPERFWDRFQSRTLPALPDHVMKLGNGRPRPEDAPFFGELTVDLTLSEPEYRLPVDQEQISSMEALHEEIYFNTIHFFDVMGRFTRGAGLAYPGRIIPIMHPKADGKPGRAKITVTGFDAAHPSVVVEYTERSGRSGVVRLDVPKIAVDWPQTLAAAVRAGRDGIERLDLRLKVDTENDERDALVKRTAEDRVDCTMLSAEQGDRGVREPGPTAIRGPLSRRVGVSRPGQPSGDRRLGAREQDRLRGRRHARAERRAGAVPRHCDLSSAR